MTQLIKRTVISTLAKSTVISSAMLIAGVAQASECDIELNHGLLINSDHIRVMDKHRTKLQINNDEQLFILGEWVKLNPEDTEILRQYSLGLRREVPQIVNIAMEGVEIGLHAIDQVVTGLSGGRSDTSINKHFEEIKFSLKKKFNRTDEHFYIAPQSLNELSDFFEDELGNELKTIVKGSMGSIMVAVGEAMRSEENSLESTISDMSERMELVSEGIESSLESKTKSLEQKAEQFCHRLIELNKYETKLQQHVPQLLDFDVVSLAEDNNM